jgi:hypothetical protein
MAKAHGPTLLHGKIGKLIYSVRNGKQFVRQAPEEYIFRKGTPAHGLNRREFAGAAKIGNEIYRSIKGSKPRKRSNINPNDILGPIFKPYSQNILTARLKKAADFETKLVHNGNYHFAHDFRFYDAVRAFRGLDLSQKTAPTDKVRFNPIGPQHNPTAIKVHGLDHAAAEISTHGNARLEFRIHIRQTEFWERTYSSNEKKWIPTDHLESSKTNKAAPEHHISSPSDWIPVEIIPAEGLTLDLQQEADFWNAKFPNGAKYLTTILIEWREVRNVGAKIKRLHDKGIARIVCLHAPAETWSHASAAKSGPAKHHIIPKAFLNGTAKPKTNPFKDPKTYLAEALAKMRRR